MAHCDSTGQYINSPFDGCTGMSACLCVDPTAINIGHKQNKGAQYKHLSGQGLSAITNITLLSGNPTHFHHLYFMFITTAYLS